MTSFHQALELLSAAGYPAQHNYPPHNIINCGNGKYMLEFAVAGFSREELKVEYDQGTMRISGEHKRQPLPVEYKYEHQGIARRKFSREFDLNREFEVVDCSLDSGILQITLYQMLPKTAQIRTVNIK